jgi:UDP-N-acetylmuramate--alanine ligase
MFEGLRFVHVIGAGGIGVSAAAKWLLRTGIKVSASDVVASPLLDTLRELGAQTFVGHAAEQVPADADLVLYSPAVPEPNVERARASELGLIQRSYPQFLGDRSRELQTVAVSGTNGKSTTTAMLGQILAEAGKDPTVVVGTLVPEFPDGNLRVGGSELFVVEACEYRGAMLELAPRMVVLTNIEEDHLDYFQGLDHIVATFQRYVRGVDRVVMNVDDPVMQQLEVGRHILYGFGERAELRAINRVAAAGEQAVDVTWHGEPCGRLVLRVPGEFNVMNALAATAAAMGLGVSFEVCAAALAKFGGCWRRFERVGCVGGVEVISDYGHHPTAIRCTLAAAREFFPGRRLVLCFQPHQHARTFELRDGFVDALGEADVILLPEIYRVSGRTEAEEISSRDLVNDLQKARPGKEVFYAADLTKTRQMLQSLVLSGDVLIVQGAGDIDEVARKLVA